MDIEIAVNIHVPVIGFYFKEYIMSAKRKGMFFVLGGMLLVL